MGQDDGVGASGTGAAAGMQFEKVEAAAQPAASCAKCKRMVTGEYFAIGGHMLCSPCGRELGGAGGGAGAVVRALLFGGAAALVGTLVWYGIIKATDREFGLIAIGVGLLVGIAVRKGARGVGGWKYQAMAMVLTYMSITASYAVKAVDDVVHGKLGDDAASTATGSPGGDSPAEPHAAPAAEPHAAPSAGAFFGAVAALFGLALVSPFMGGADNIMGLLIIGIALYEAWKINKRVPITGPFRLGPEVAAPPLAVP